MVFIDARTGPRAFDNVRIEKILHKDDTIVSEICGFCTKQRNHALLP